MIVNSTGWMSGFWNSITRRAMALGAVTLRSPMHRRQRRREGAQAAALESRMLLSAAFPEFVDPNPNAGNQFGHSVVALSGGNVVITSPFDDAGGTDAGAVYLFNGATGALISTLTGSSANDNVGNNGVTALSNGNYVVRSLNWDGAVADEGAVTWGSGTTGISGAVSAANSLVGSTLNDQVGNGGVTALSNGNYVLSSRNWDGAAADVGAVTFGSGTTGISGAVSAANSLVGSTLNDQVGIFGVTALSNGNYVVGSADWDGAAANVGAVTWGSGTTGISGAVTASNSLVGSTLIDNVGNGGVTVLSNGNYVVGSMTWNGAAANVGAVTFGSGTTGISGAVSAANSLVGSTSSDEVGNGGVTALSNGNYVVSSQFWDGAAVNVGAVTFGSGTTGISGAVSVSNSLVGTTLGNDVGNGGVTALSNGNYVVRSANWDGAAADVGAVTFGSGTTGISGAVSASNSLVGSTSSDQVGNTGVRALSNGNYVVSSINWDGAAANVGAVTFGSGTTGISGAVSASNSLVGTTLNDFVGNNGVTALSNGNYVVRSSLWNGAAADVGAVTFGSGTIGISGAVSSTNSAIGLTASTSLQAVVVDDSNSTFFGRFRDEVGGFGGRVRVGSQVDGFAVSPAVNLSVSAATGTEAGRTQITVTATAAAAVSGAQTVTIAVTGTGITAGDFTLSNTTITIPNGQTTGSVTFTIRDDLQNEGAETATLTISNPSAGITLGTTLTQDIAITDNETATSASYGTPDDNLADSVRVVLNGANVEIRSVPGDVLLDSRTFASLSGGLAIQGADGEDDMLTVDIQDGNPIPSGGLTFHGGTGSNDSLRLMGGATTTVTHTFTNANDGSVTLAGAFTGTISYTGIEPITDNLNATNRVFTFNGGAETISLSDAGGDQLLIDSDAAESVSFASPSGTLTINAGTGDDTILVAALGSTLTSGLTINGDAGDDFISLNGDIAFASDKSLNLDLQNDDASPGSDQITIATNANLILAGSGAATLKASRTIALTTGSSLFTVNGNIQLEANQQLVPTTGFFDGISLVSGSSVTASGSGSVTLLGKGGDDATGLKDGIIVVGATISGATTTLVGVGGSSTGDSNHGVLITGSNTITSTGGGISITGTAGGTGASVNNIGVVSNGSLSTNNANLTFTTDILDLPSGSLNAGSGSVTIVTLTAARAIDLGTNTTGSLSLTDAELDRVTSGTTQIGDANSGTMTVSAAITHGNHLSLTTGAGLATNSGTSFTLAANKNFAATTLSTTAALDIKSITASGSGTVSLTAARNIRLETAQVITTVDGNVTLLANQASTGTGDFNGLDLQGSVTTTGSGSVTINGIGGTGATALSNIGVRFTNNGATSTTGTGGITINGTGGTGSGGANLGVRLAGYQITTAAGPIQLTGVGGSSVAGVDLGLQLFGVNLVRSGGSGAVTVNGTGGSGAGGGAGIELQGVAGTSRITSLGGNVEVTGLGRAANSSGISLLGTSEISAGGAGSVTVNGTGGTDGTSAGQGVVLNSSTTTITSAGGNVMVIGDAGTTTSTSSFGVRVDGPITAGGSGTVTVSGRSDAGFGVQLSGSAGQITSGGGNVQVTAQGGTFRTLSLGSSSSITTATNGGSITAIANGMDLPTGSAINAGANSVTLRPFTNGFAIHLGSIDTAAQLGLTDLELDRVTAGTLHIGDTNSGAITFSQDITRTASTHINLTTGANNNIAFGTFSLDAGSGGDVTLTTSGSGAITTSDNTGTDLTADDVTLNAGSNGIGSSTNFLRLAATTVVASTTSNAAINLVELNSVTIGSADLNAGTGTTTLGGGTFLTSSGNNIVGNAVVRSGATLGGTGSVTGTLTTQSGGHVAPGMSPGILNAGNVSFASGSTFDVEIGGTTPGNAPTNHDQLVVTGTVSLGSATLNTTAFNGFVPITGNTFAILLNDGSDAITGTFSGLAQGAVITNFLGTTLNATISYVGNADGGASGNDVVLTVGMSPTLSSALASGDLTITDSEGTKANSLTVSVSGSNLVITDANEAFISAPAGGTLSNGNKTLTIPAASVTGTLTINLVGGTDTIDIGTLGTTLLASLTIDAGAGTDTVNFNGDVTFASGKNLLVNADTLNTAAGAVLITSGAGVMAITADDIALSTTSTLFSSNTVTFVTQTAGRAINLGTNTGGSLSLTDAELDRVTAGGFAIGDANSGAMTLSADITLSTILVLQLTTGANNNIAFGAFSLSTGSIGVSLISSGTGAITTGDNTGTDLTAGLVSLAAGSGGIASTTNFLRLAATTVVASTTSNAAINLAELNSVTIGTGDLNAGTGTTTLGGGTFLTGLGRDILGPVTVASGATLGGTGTVSGTITTQSGGTVAPGNSPGILNSGNVTLVSGSNFNVEVNGSTTAGTDYDQLNVTGTVDVTGATLSATGSIASSPGQTVVLINNDSNDSITGTFSGRAEGATVTINGVNFTISYVGGTNNNDVVLTETVPPVVDLNAGGAGQDVTTAFTEQTPVLIAPVGALSDADSANLTSLIVTLTARPNGDAVESLSLNAAATAASLGLTVSYTSGTGVLSITGSATKATYQTIQQGVLYNNTSNTPTTSSRSITVVANDGTDPSATQTVTLTVAAVNDAPTAVVLLNTTTSLAELTSTATRIKVADIQVTDDSLGTNVLSRSGVDNAFFEIVGTELFLRAGTVLNFESKSSYSVTVDVNDASVGGTPDASVGFTLSITDVAEYKADVIIRDVGPTGTGNEFLALNSNGSSFTVNTANVFAVGSWERFLTGDFNGDGRADIAGRLSTTGAWWVSLANASGVHQTATQWGAWSAAATWVEAVVGDFDGDGRDDIAGRVSNGDWWVSRSTGTRLQATKWGNWSNNTTWSNTLVGDFNRDGRTDIAARITNGDWMVSLSTGIAFTTSRWGKWDTAVNSVPVTWVDVSVGDFNGDGRADIAGRSTIGQWWVNISKGTTFGFAVSYGSWSTTTTWSNVSVGDFNGDGRDDIIGRNTIGQWWVAEATGTKFTNKLLGTWASPQSQWSEVLVGDFNRDGHADLVGRNNLTNQVWVSLWTPTTTPSLTTTAWASLTAPTGQQWRLLKTARLMG